MDEQTLIVEQPFSITGFFKKLVHRFNNGNEPYGDSVFQIRTDFSSSWGLTYDSHPGPVDDAIVDAKNLNRSLFIFVYCKENALTQRTVQILSLPSVAAEISQNFLFLPLDVTTPEGLSVASSLEFHELPLIALVRPRGTTLKGSQVFVKHEGKIGESVLISYIRVEHREETTMVQQQDDEYTRALEEENARLQRIQEQEDQERIQEEILEAQKLSVEEAFEALPPPPVSGERTTVKFQLPDNTTQTRSFPRDGPTSMLHVFVRKFVFPNNFQIRAGFPPILVEEINTPLGDTIRDKQFIAYVDLSE